MRTWIIALAALATSTVVFSADKPKVRACHENEDSHPWILKDKPGLNIIMFRAVEKQTGGKIETVPLPWKRCLEEVKAGTMDAAFKISYSAQRAAEMGSYPMVGDKPDASKRMLMDSYSLYRLKGSAVEWDGKTLKATGSVGAQSGFSVVEQLKSMGLTVDDGSRSPDDNLKKLVNGRFSVLALQTDEGDSKVAGNPEFSGKIERIKPALIEKPYFLMFSKSFAAKNPDYVKEVWSAIAQVRESAEYTSAAKSFK